MSKEYTALGLMSGTSGDGIDASIIKSDGRSNYDVIIDRYFEYESEIYNNIHDLKKKINNSNDLKIHLNDLKSLEKKITLFHARVIKEVTKSQDIDLVGFHGQTIYHNSKEKISRQLGDGNLLFQLIKKNIVFNFRENDLKNGGEGAPLTPIFHHLVLKQKEISLPACILNIGGISNLTIVNKEDLSEMSSRDIGPGNCLIDLWLRRNSKKKFDKNGEIASRGNINEIILEQAQELYSNRSNKENHSLDVNDFDVSFARGLSLEDGVSTLTEFTSRIIAESLLNYIPDIKKKKWKILISGGGRKNQFLIDRIKQKTTKNITIKSIDDHGLNGDFVESQAFAYLAIRSYIGEIISFPKTTGCLKPCSGGQIIKVT